MTLYIALVLHIYQPPTQKAEVLKKICRESYEPLFRLLMEKKTAKITLNINGSLTELLHFYDEQEILKNIKQLTFNQQIELLGTSCYHAILPLIPKEEITRQISLNTNVQQTLLGKELFHPQGFWLPEMAYDFGVIEPLIENNYRYSVISSVACQYGELPDSFIPKIQDNFLIFFRNDLLSNLISFGNPSVKHFYKEMQGEKNPKKDDYYLILAMDGETFGHHIKDNITNFLAPLVDRITTDSNITMVNLRELPVIFKEQKKLIPLPSSWSTSAEDLQKGIPLPVWSDPNNRIHQLQQKVMNHALFLIGLAQKCKNNHTKETTIRFQNARSWLDKGLHSCQLWWASGNPWYSSEMILKGLNQLILASSEALKVILWNSNCNQTKEKAMAFFNEIFEAQKEIYLTV
jgi:predicted glycosyl hydrolase (DUF1957 family)